MDPPVPPPMTPLFKLPHACTLLKTVLDHLCFHYSTEASATDAESPYSQLLEADDSEATDQIRELLLHQIQDFDAYLSISGNVVNFLKAEFYKYHHLARPFEPYEEDILKFWHMLHSIGDMVVNINNRLKEICEDLHPDCARIDLKFLHDTLECTKKQYQIIKAANFISIISFILQKLIRDVIGMQEVCGLMSMDVQSLAKDCFHFSTLLHDNHARCTPMPTEQEPHQSADKDQSVNISETEVNLRGGGWNYTDDFEEGNNYLDEMDSPAVNSYSSDASLHENSEEDLDSQLPLFQISEIVSARTSYTKTGHKITQALVSWVPFSVKLRPRSLEAQNLKQFSTLEGVSVTILSEKLGRDGNHLEYVVQPDSTWIPLPPGTSLSELEMNGYKLHMAKPLSQVLQVGLKKKAESGLEQDIPNAQAAALIPTPPPSPECTRIQAPSLLDSKSSLSSWPCCPLSEMTAESTRRRHIRKILKGIENRNMKVENMLDSQPLVVMMQRETYTNDTGNDQIFEDLHQQSRTLLREVDTRLHGLLTIMSEISVQRDRYGSLNSQESARGRKRPSDQATEFDSAARLRRNRAGMNQTERFHDEIANHDEMGSVEEDGKDMENIEKAGCGHQLHPQRSHGCNEEYTNKSWNKDNEEYGDAGGFQWLMAASDNVKLTKREQNWKNMSASKYQHQRSAKNDDIDDNNPFGQVRPSVSGSRVALKRKPSLDLLDELQVTAAHERKAKKLKSEHDQRAPISVVRPVSPKPLVITPPPNDLPSQFVSPDLLWRPFRLKDDSTSHPNRMIDSDWEEIGDLMTLMRTVELESPKAKDKSDVFFLKNSSPWSSIDSEIDPLFLGEDLCEDIKNEMDHHSEESPPLPGKCHLSQLELHPPANDDDGPPTIESTLRGSPSPSLSDTNTNTNPEFGTSASSRQTGPKEKLNGGFSDNINLVGAKMNSRGEKWSDGNNSFCPAFSD